MDLSRVTRENKELIAVGAGILWIISLFFPWYDLGGNVSGWDAVASSWIPLIFMVLGCAALAADAFAVELPVRVNAPSFAAYCVSIPLIINLMYVFEGSGSRKWGLFLALVFSIAAFAAAAVVWREET
jgi:peptidoglycan/LPS O-acetylase OafA/YrhL